MEEHVKEQKVSRREMRKKKNKEMIRRIILVIAVITFCISGWELYKILSEYQKGSNEYNDLQDLVVEQGGVIADVNAGPGEVMELEKIFKVNFEELMAINEDTVGWIRFKEPSEISYPLVLSADNADYLYTTFEGKSNSAGTLFVDYKNTGDFDEENTFIHGHNMKNGSMFGRLRKFRDSSYRTENPYFSIYTPDGRELVYEVFAVCVVKDTSQTYDREYENTQEFQEYLNYVKKSALYNTGVEVTADSKIVSLSTCTNVTDDERLVVHGVMIEEKAVGE